MKKQMMKVGIKGIQCPTCYLKPACPGSGKTDCKHYHSLESVMRQEVKK